jgi:thymidylate kinase
MARRLILVEGMPGAGKSSTTQYLADLLNQNHQPARWIEEREAEQYFDAFWQAANRGETDLTGPLLACWRSFLAAIEPWAETVLFDASLYYAMHLMERNVPAAEIEAYTLSLYELTRSVPVTVVMLTGDVRTVFQRIAERRGPNWTAGCLADVNGQPYQVARKREGMAGAIAFFTEGQALVSQIVKASPWEQLWFDTTAERWGEVEERLQAFFGCKPTAPVVLSPALLERYAGTYAWPEGAPFSGELRIALDPDGRLRAETSYRQDLMLVPVTESRFSIKATPLAVAFDMDANGRVNGVQYTDFGGVVYTCQRLG